MVEFQLDDTQEGTNQHKYNPNGTHKTLSFNVGGSSRGSSRGTSAAVSRSGSNLSSHSIRRGYSVEGLTGEQINIRKRWLIDWVKELKSRLPAFTAKQLPDPSPADNFNEEEVEDILAILPEHEVHRFEVMYTRTMGMVNSMAAAMDPEFLDNHVSNALQRYKETKRSFITASYEREKQEQAEKDKIKPWEFAVNAFASRVNAAVIIQRKFRQFRAQCQEQGWYPSDENPEHWKHWVDFRQKHGWADNELVDAYGDELERTDGGKSRKWGRSKPAPSVEARYLESIGHLKEERTLQHSPTQFDREAADLLRAHDRAHRMMEILATRLVRLQEREARRAQWRAEAEARRRAGQLVSDDDGIESDTDEDEADKRLPADERERKRQERYLAFISDPEVRKLVQQGVGPFRPTMLGSSNDYLSSLMAAMSTPGVRDSNTDITAMVNSNTNRMSKLLSSFQQAHKYKMMLAAAKKEGALLPVPPKDLQPEVLALYEDVLQSVLESYQLDLEKALREGRTPPEPPKGASKEVHALYKDALANMHRLETGYDTDDAEEDAPRVRKLTKYGQMWMKAMETSTANRRRLLRTRSQGNLGLQNAVLYRAAGQGKQRFERQVSDTKKTTDEPTTSMSGNATQGEGTTSEGGMMGENSMLISRKVDRKFSFKDLSVSHATTLQPLTARVAFKLIASLASNPGRRHRPLVLMDSQQLEGIDWSHTSKVPEGLAVKGILQRVAQPSSPPASTYQARHEPVASISSSGVKSSTGGNNVFGSMVVATQLKPTQANMPNQVSSAGNNEAKPVASSQPTMLRAGIASNEYAGVSSQTASVAGAGVHLTDEDMKFWGLKQPQHGTHKLDNDHISSASFNHSAQHPSNFQTPYLGNKPDQSGTQSHLAVNTQQLAPSNSLGALQLMHSHPVYDPTLPPSPSTPAPLTAAQQMLGSSLQAQQQQTNASQPFEDASVNAWLAVRASAPLIQAQSTNFNTVLPMQGVQLLQPTAQGFGAASAYIDPGMLLLSGGLATRQNQNTSGFSFGPTYNPASVSSSMPHPGHTVVTATAQGSGISPGSTNDTSKPSLVSTQAGSVQAAGSGMAGVSHVQQPYALLRQQTAILASGIGLQGWSQPGFSSPMYGSTQSNPGAGLGASSLTQAAPNQQQGGLPWQGQLQGQHYLCQQKVLQQGGMQGAAQQGQQQYMYTQQPQGQLSSASYMTGGQQQRAYNKAAGVTFRDLPLHQETDPGGAQALLMNNITKPSFGFNNPTSNSKSCPGYTNDGRSNFPSEGGMANPSDMFALLAQKTVKAPAPSVAQLMGKSAGSNLWRKARDAVRGLLSSYQPEVEDMLREAGLTDLGPAQMLEKAMTLLRAPKRMQIEDCGEVMEVKARPHSAGTTRDVDKQAAAAVIRQGAAVNSGVVNTLTALGKMQQKPKHHALAVGGLERSNKRAAVQQSPANRGDAEEQPKHSDEAPAEGLLAEQQLRVPATQQTAVNGGNATTQQPKPDPKVQDNNVDGDEASDEEYTHLTVPSIGWREVSRTLSVGGLGRLPSMAARQALSRAASQAGRHQDTEDEDETETAASSSPGHVQLTTAKDLAHLEGSGLDSPFRPSSTQSMRIRQRTTDEQKQSNLRQVVDDDDQGGDHQLPGLPPGPFNQLGNVLADVFLEQQRLARAEERVTNCLEALYPAGMDPSGAKGLSKWNQARDAVAKQLAQDRFEQEQALLQHFQQLYGKDSGNKKIMFTAKKLSLARITPEMKKAMLQKYVNVFKSTQYGWLNSHLRMGVIPGKLANTNNDNDGAQGPESNSSETRVTRATEKRLAKSGGGSASSSRVQSRGQSRGGASRPGTEGGYDKSSRLSRHATEAGAAALIKPTDSPRISDNGGYGVGGRASDGGNYRGGDVAANFHRAGAALMQSDLTAGSHQTSDTRGGIGLSADSTMGKANQTLPSRQHVVTKYTDPLAGFFNSTACGPALDPDLPPWLARLSQRMTVANKLGLSASSAQRMRFQQVAAMRERSVGQPASMQAALTISKPTNPGHIEPGDSLAATLPGSQTRPQTVGTHSGLNSPSSGGDSLTMTLGASVVSASPVPYTQLSPRRPRLPPNCQEVLTPFGVRTVIKPLAVPVPERHAGVTTRSPQNVAAFGRAQSQSFCGLQDGREAKIGALMDSGPLNRNCFTASGSNSRALQPTTACQGYVNPLRQSAPAGIPSAKMEASPSKRLAPLSRTALDTSRPLMTATTIVRVQKRAA